MPDLVRMDVSIRMGSAPPNVPERLRDVHENDEIKCAAGYAALNRKDSDVKRTLNAAIVGTVLSILPFGALAQGPVVAPFAAQAKMTCAQALSQVSKDDPELAKMAKGFDAEGVRLKKSPRDLKVKKAYVDSGVKYEQKIVRGANKLNPAVKYRAGLALCRLVLAVDPKNIECKKDMGEIVGIYKNMGRPVPQ